MNPHKQEFLNLKTMPARLSMEETAWYLGFSPHDIPILNAVGLLKPLGHPATSGTKFFATIVVDELRRDPKWLARATDAIVDYWKNKNARKKAAHEEVPRVPHGRNNFKSQLSSPRSHLSDGEE